MAVEEARGIALTERDKARARDRADRLARPLGEKGLRIPDYGAHVGDIAIRSLRQESPVEEDRSQTDVLGFDVAGRRALPNRINLLLALTTKQLDGKLFAKRDEQMAAIEAMTGLSEEDRKAAQVELRDGQDKRIESVFDPNDSVMRGLAVTSDGLRELIDFAEDRGLDTTALIERRQSIK
ncbi:MAG TPA: hypothetical protein VL989_00460 [Candidatus Sulfotelmatobacter sp.]|nr:hypothetical protein [Candidatus Sulfotelmatobacter sp.]